MPKVAALLLDCDGTLLDTEPLYVAAYAKVAASLGKPYSDAFHVQHLLGLPEAQGAAAFATQLSVPLDGEGVLRLRDEHLSFEGVAPLPGALALAQCAQRLELPCAIATAGLRAYTDVKAASNPELFSLVKHVLCGDDTLMTGRRGKPAPDIYHAAAALLGVAAHECIVFEDSLAGVTAGVAAGAFVVCCPDKRVPEAAFVKAGAHYIVSSLEGFALTALIADLESGAIPWQQRASHPAAAPEAVA